MFKKLISLIKSKMHGALSGAHAFLMLPLTNNFLLSNTIQLQDNTRSLSTFLGNFLDFVMELVNTFFYIIAKYILLFIDMCQVVVYKIAGIDADFNKLLELPVFKFLFNKTVLGVIGTLMIVGLVLLILATIVALVKSEYEVAIEGDKKDSKVSAYKVIGKSLVSLFMMVITPFIIVIVIVFSSVLLTSINNVLNPDGSENATLGGQVFVSSAYNANKYRNYADNGRRVPILYGFEDPYENGTWKDYTSEELASIYASWDGDSYYYKDASNTFDSFPSTLVYKNNQMYNSSSYSEFEKFVSTPEQYYIMADFIDYAMSHDMTFYIKDARDHEIDWDRVSSDVKLSNGVYDPLNQSITLTYTDVNNISPYDNYYTVTFETGSVSATTPIGDAIKTISMIMGLFSLDSDAVDSIANGAFNVSDQDVNISNSALTQVASQINSSIVSGLASVNGDPSVTFRILERVEGSTNVVRWQTEKAIYGNQEYTVYELNKIYKNQNTGINETKATVKVAKRDDSLNSKFYVLKEEPSITGYYEYTNITIDYYNDGKYFLDTLEPVYKRVTWPEKLYNDLNVIYQDIDFDNYINYDNWADALGVYFNANSGVNDASVSTFATTLVHPLGLIMAELFMGVAFEGDNTTTTDFAFTSNYLDDAIDAVILSIGGQFEFQNIKDQINYFVKLFNAQFTSVIQSLKTIENFDIYGNDESSVEAYVYKAYLSSIMLATDYSDYLIKMSNTILRTNRLLELMSYGANGVVRDENGNVVYETVFAEDELGNKIPLVSTYGVGKAVYNKFGEKRYTCYADGEYGFFDKLLNSPNNGDLSNEGILIPKHNVRYSIRPEVRKTGLGSQTTHYVYYVYVDNHPKFEYNTSSNTFTYNTTEKTMVGKYVKASNLFLTREKFEKAYKDYLNDYDKYLKDKEKYDKKIDEDPSYDGEVPIEPEKPMPIYWEDYFEPYFECYSHLIDDNNILTADEIIINFYAYEPLDGDTSAQNLNENNIARKLISKIEGKQGLIDSHAETYYKINTKENDKNWLGAGYVNELNEYFLYETELEVKSNSAYLTYGRLSPNFQQLIDDIIVDMKKDFERLEISEENEPLYIKFLEEYQVDSTEMEKVMSAKTISSKVASKYYNSHSTIESNIEYYQLELDEATNDADRINYQKKLQNEQNKLYRLKKHYIIEAIERYVSNKITSEFTVIVNGHPYDVSQGINTRNLMEIVYGNNLTYESLINALKNKQPYSRLSEFNKDAILDFRGFLEIYSYKILSLLVERNGEYVLFSGAVDDNLLNLASRFYRAKTNTYINLTNASVKKLDAQTKEDIVEVLTLYCSDLKTMYNNYIAGKRITEGTHVQYASEEEAYNALAFVIEFNMLGSKLSYVDDDYQGIVDANGVGFGLLKDFLTDFGNVCFDLARKTNIGNIREESSNNFLDYVSDFALSLNRVLADIDFGSASDIKLIPVVSDSSVLMTVAGNHVESSTTFSELDNTSKTYIYEIYELYATLSSDYEKVLASYEKNRDYAVRYINNRYAMYENSFVFDSGLKEYLDYFRYNALVHPQDISEDEFKEKYVYEGYQGKLTELDDRVYYYNLYLSAFDGIVIGNNGVYFDNLSDLQMKVMTDLADYFSEAYSKFKTENETEYQQNLYYRNLLYNFIYNGSTYGAASNAGLTNIAAQASIGQIFDGNVDVLNLYNMLDYLGIQFDVNKTLAEYRLEALNSMIDFKEKAGESGVSIQSRYLALLYLFCSDYTVGADGKVRITIDENTKQTVLKLAGIQDQAEELLVGLEYQVDFTDAKSDEAEGSVYIICTYNEASMMYEPFVFASGADKYGTPYSDYYASPDGTIKYYPIIAKGVIDPNGRPTAIREVNGYIEFYRDNITIVDTAYLNIDMYYMSAQEVEVNYNVVSLLVNAVTKLFTGKTLAEHIIDNFPIITATNDLGFAYGKKTDYVYHLENGAFTLNYMFYTSSGIGMNCLYEMGKLNTIVLTLGTLVVAFSLINALFGVIRNLYEIVILVMISPGAYAMYPLKSDIQGNWRKEFIDKLLVMFGYIISINGFFIIIRVVESMDIGFMLSPESKEYLKNTFLFGSFSVDTIIHNLMDIAMFLVAVTLLNTLPKLFSKMAGGGDVLEKGAYTKAAVKTNIEEATYFTSGYAVEDMILSKTDALKSLPLIGSDKRAARQEARQIAANKKAVDAYRTRLKNNGVKDEIVDKATKAYEDSLKRQVEAERARRLKDREARAARIKRRQTRLSEQAARYDDDEYKDKTKKPKQCPKCKAMLFYKSKKCPHCGTKL